MINPDHDLSLTRQAELLQLSRTSLYYEPVGVSQADLKLMRRIDELHLEWPFLGLDSGPAGELDIDGTIRRRRLAARTRQARS